MMQITSRNKTWNLLRGLLRITPYGCDGEHVEAHTIAQGLGLRGVPGEKVLTCFGITPVQEKEAETFVRKRFTPLLEKKEANFTVEIVKFLTDNDSISNVICKRAEDLNAVSVVRWPDGEP
jgi:hypothetical protein